MKKVNPIGEKYGKLTVLNEHSRTRNHHYRYTCQCECGNTCNVLLTHLRQGNTTSCGCDKTTTGARNVGWKGYKEISGTFWQHHIVRSATGDKGRRTPLELSISIKYAWELFIKQDKKCALSGLEIKFPDKQTDKSWTASLDRIDSSKGYVEGNVQWVHKDVNIMKNKFNQEYFKKMCTLVSLVGGCEVI